MEKSLNLKSGRISYNTGQGALCTMRIGRGSESLHIRKYMDNNDELVFEWYNDGDEIEYTMIFGEEEALEILKTLGMFCHDVEFRTTRKVS